MSKELVEALERAADSLEELGNDYSIPCQEWCHFRAAQARAALAAHREAVPVAWMHADGRVIRAATMESARRDGGAMLSSVAGYTIPLYAAPPAEPKAGGA